MLHGNSRALIGSDVAVFRCLLICGVQFFASYPIFPNFGFIKAFIDCQAMCFYLVWI
jgi:hypothetical protein